MSTLAIGSRRRKLLYAIAQHSLLITVGLFFAAPIVFIVLSSLMNKTQSPGTNLWPEPFRIQNFADVFSSVRLIRFTWNTTLIATLSSAGVIVSCVPAAYALARLQFRGRGFLFILVLSTMMLPFQVTVIPIYVLFSQIGWIGSLKPLWVPSFFGDAFSIFLLRQFFMTIPEDLSDAARIDGANEIQVMLRVIAPLAKPAIAAVAIFNFLYNWNDLFGPLLYLSQKPGAYTLSLALSEFQGSRHVEWNLTMAAALLIMLPTTVIFFLAQRVFVEGVTVTGVKG